MKHPVTGDKVYVFWDACHMLKLCRNKLGDNKVLFDGENLLHLQAMEGLRAACKLSKRHINFHNERMNVRLAAQTLSASVSCALKFVQQNVQNVGFRDIDGTALYCLNINNGFDILNARNVFSKNKYCCPIRPNNYEFIKTKSEHLIDYIKSFRDSNQKCLIVTKT